MTKEQIERAYLTLRDSLLLEYGKRLRSRDRAEDMLGDALVSLLEVATPYEESDSYVEGRLKFAMENERKLDWKKDRSLGKKVILVSLDEPTSLLPGEKSSDRDDDERMDPPDDRPNPEEECIQEDWAVRIREAVDDLGGQKATVIRMVLLKGKTLEEAAKAMGLGVGTVRRYYHEGKATLAKVLKDKV